MEQWQWLVGVVVAVMVLWLLWSLTRTIGSAPAKPDLDMPRPVPRPSETATATEDVARLSLPAAEGPPDDLRRIKGVGPKLHTLLGELGVSRYDQIAGFSESDLGRLDAQLGTFQGRPQRDNWVEQAEYLARGDTAGFEAKFGKLGA